MNHLLTVQFETLLSRQELETIMTSQNCFTISSTIATKIQQFVSSKYYNTHFYLLISKLFNDSIKSLHEDSRELLKIKHKEKFETFQSKASIAEYIQEIEMLCKSDDTETFSTTSTSTDIFTTEEEPKTKKTFKDIKKEVSKPLKKNASSKSKKDDEETIVKNIKDSRQVEDYSEVEFNDDDNDKINNIFFD